MKTKIALLVMAAALVGCGGPQMYATKETKPVPKERNEVIARRAAFEVQLAEQRAQWANDCMKNKEVEMMFESDRSTRCLMFAKEIHPDVITQRLLAEFNGDLVVPEVKNEQ